MHFVVFCVFRQGPNLREDISLQTFMATVACASYFTSIVPRSLLSLRHEGCCKLLAGNGCKRLGGNARDVGMGKLTRIPATSQRLNQLYGGRHSPRKDLHEQALI